MATKFNLIKLDIDLARYILLNLQNSSSIRFPALSSPSIKEFLYHIQELNEAGFLEGPEISNIDELKQAEINLTERGRAFLDLIRDEKIWLGIKNTIGGKSVGLYEVENIARKIYDTNRHWSSSDGTIAAAGPTRDRSGGIIAPTPLSTPTGDRVFGSRIKKLRLERGWSQKDLAARAGLSASSISKIETGMVRAGQSNIILLAAALGVQPKFIVLDTDYTDMFPADSLAQEQPTSNGSPETSSSPGDETEQAEESHTVQIGTVGDQPTADDKLGFKPYVEAIAKFLMDPKTKGPLTMSIEGEWGSGKSSFMLQTEEELKKIDPDILTVHFNAWRYDKEDALWAAFATRMIKELSQKVSWRNRFKAKFELFRRRFDWRKGWFSFLTLGLVALSLFYLAVLLVNNYFQHLSEFAPLGSWLAQALSKDGADLVIRFLTLTVAGYLILYVLAFRKINEFLINPLTTDFKKHLRAPDYKKRATFLDEFHEDFSKIIEAYAGKGENARRVFVFIDDLDRCDVPKSAELMQALNLMLSENPQLYFIIGMDREKVAAGIAVKHEKLLEYLAPSSPTDKPNANPKLEYGFEFIEKFIQVPFKVPQARPDDIEKLIMELSGRTSVSSQTTTNILDEPVAVDSIKFSTGLTKPTRWVESNVIYKPVESKEPPKQEDVDSPAIDKVIKTVGPFFDYNPRRIKQFLNIYRLKIYIGNETGLFNPPPEGSAHKRINLYKLGKFVAIDLRYPMLIAELDDNPMLLDELQKLAAEDLEASSVSSDYWAAKIRLKKLLMSRVEHDMELPEFYDKYGLNNININLLLQISPAIKPMPAAEAESSPADDKPVR
ncbi:MAG TPA: P-loop NTPase fold protein [Pyrinomonadaceae bacterium]|jgi:transcriptional regulator with XRE-family HTH domain|nr:P-loop NTPase fold protein [Pyrinomonadaceae bacterium]